MCFFLMIQYLEVARTLKYYGFLQFRPCTCDYPRPGSRVLVGIGNSELNLRVRLGDGQDIREGSFKVTRMRCWRITTLHNVSFRYFYCRIHLYICCVELLYVILKRTCFPTVTEIKVTFWHCKMVKEMMVVHYS